MLLLSTKSPEIQFKLYFQRRRNPQSTGGYHNSIARSFYEDEELEPAFQENNAFEKGRDGKTSSEVELREHLDLCESDVPAFPNCSSADYIMCCRLPMLQ